MLMMYDDGDDGGDYVKCCTRFKVTRLACDFYKSFSSFFRSLKVSCFDRYYLLV